MTRIERGFIGFVVQPAAVSAGDADIAIATEWLSSVPEVVTFPYYTWHHALIVPRDHPLAERHDLSLADIATRTRVTQRHLQAIENSEFSELPGRTYVTGFARAYARALDLPEAEIAAELRRELDEDEYGARPLYEAYEPTDPAR